MPILRQRSVASMVRSEASLLEPKYNDGAWRLGIRWRAANVNESVRAPKNRRKRRPVAQKRAPGGARMPVILTGLTLTSPASSQGPRPTPGGTNRLPERTSRKKPKRSNEALAGQLAHGLELGHVRVKRSPPRRHPRFIPRADHGIRGLLSDFQ